MTRTSNGTATKHEHTYKYEITITSLLLLYNCYTPHSSFYQFILSTPLENQQIKLQVNYLEMSAFRQGCTSHTLRFFNFAKFCLFLGLQIFELFFAFREASAIFMVFSNFCDIHFNPLNEGRT